MSKKFRVTETQDGTIRLYAGDMFYDMSVTTAKNISKGLALAAESLCSKKANGQA